MSARATDDEDKQKHIKAMGKDLGVLFQKLSNELTLLYFKWNEYVELFGKKPSRIDLLNSSAGQFFWIVQDSLWEGCLLHIARLTDPEKIGTKTNLTIKRLPRLIEDEKLKEQISQLVEAADNKVEFCRDWRNRRIAHSDLKLVLETGAEPLKPASRARVKDALSSLTDVLKKVYEHYYKDSTVFFGQIKSIHGAEALLYVIEDGLWTEQERNKRWQAGEYREEDFRNRDV